MQNAPSIGPACAPMSRPNMQRKTPQLHHLAALLGLCLCLCVTNASAQNKQYGLGLGRLLTSEFERGKLDEVRFNKTAPPAVYEGPPQLNIDGITQRPGQPKGKDITVWIDRRAYLESELPSGLSLVRDASGKVIGLNSKQGNNKIEFAKIGEAISRPQTPEEAKAIAQAALDEKASREATAKFANTDKK